MRCGGDTGGLGEGSSIDGKYSLHQKLSEGGGGVVWLAIDPHGNEVALKTLKWSPLKSRALASERFKNEFAIFKTLAHPNIARIFDFGYDPGHNVYYFTSELLTAGDLRSYLTSPVEEIEPLLLQALRSLEYLRNSGLVHLDIKPQNFLIRESEGAPKLVLIDFGLATMRPSDRPGGTANYMPPEIAARRMPEEAKDFDFPPPDHRSDLYSLGVTFYYLLTGVQPFAIKKEGTDRLDINETLKQHINLVDPPPPSRYRSDIPQYLDTIIMKLMAHHPDDRYPAAAVAAQALRYRSPRELEPEDMESLLSYLPKRGKMVGRAQEIRQAEESLAAITGQFPHAKPILCIAGSRGVGRSRLLETLKPHAQRLEMEVSFINALQADADEITMLSRAESTTPKPHALIIDDLDYMLSGDAGKTESSTFLTPLKEFIHRARRIQKLSNPTIPPTFIALALNTDHITVERAMELLDIDQSMIEVVKLNNFTVTEVGEYLGSLLGEEPSDEAATNLHQVTEGNPLFITEQLERMISDGHLFSLAGRPDASTLEVIGLDFQRFPPPQSLTEMTIDRFERLSPSEQNLLSLMACWNQPVGLEELHHTSGEKHMEGELIHLLSTGFIQRMPNDEGRINFSNPMTASIIESHIPEKVSAVMHSRIADYLQRNRPSERSLIDHHRAHGARKPLKLRALERLAKEAEANRRPHEATEHLESLLEEVPTNAWDLRADVLVRLGRAYEWAYMPKHSQEAFQRLKNLRAPRDKKHKYKVRALEQLALAAIRRRELDEAREYITEALKQLGKSRNNLSARLRMENFLAGIDLRDGHIEEALEHFEKTSVLAEELPTPERNSITNNELGEALLQAGKVDEAQKILMAELGEAKEKDDLDRVCSRHYLLGNVLSSPQIGKYEQALKHYDQAFILARNRHLLRLQIRIHNSIGNLHLDKGELDQAIDNYKKGLALSEQIDSKTTSVELMVGLGLAHARKEDVDASIEYFEAALDFSGGPMGISAGLIKRFQPTIYVHLGDAYYRKKNFDKAFDYLGRAKELDEQRELSDEIRYSIYGTFAEVYIEMGEAEKAREYLPTLEEIVKSFPAAKEHLNQLEKKMVHT